MSLLPPNHRVSAHVGVRLSFTGKQKGQGLIPCSLVFGQGVEALGDGYRLFLRDAGGCEFGEVVDGGDVLLGVEYCLRLHIKSLRDPS